MEVRKNYEKMFSTKAFLPTYLLRQLRVKTTNIKTEVGKKYT